MIKYDPLQIFDISKKEKNKENKTTLENTVLNISENSLSKVNIKLMYDKTDKPSIFLPPLRFSIIMTSGSHQKFYVEIHFSKALKPVLNFESQ